MTRIPGTTFHDEGPMPFDRSVEFFEEHVGKFPMTVRQWLDDQRRLQLETYGDDVDTKQGDDWAASLMMNVTALVSELGEMANEVPWKPWSRTRGRPSPEAAGRAKKELVDCMHFVANLFLLLGFTAEEFEAAWVAKQRVNRERQVRGYDTTAQGEKCPSCGRASDD